MADANERLALVHTLARELGVELEGSRVAVGEDAEARLRDGSLKARVSSGYDGQTFDGYVIVETPKAPGVIIELVDHEHGTIAPAEAIYRVKFFRRDDNGLIDLRYKDGSIPFFYIGRNGIIDPREESSGR